MPPIDPPAPPEPTSPPAPALPVELPWPEVVDPVLPGLFAVESSFEQLQLAKQTRGRRTDQLAAAYFMASPISRVFSWPFHACSRDRLPDEARPVRSRRV